MSRSSSRRGQTEPFGALAAVFAVGVGLTIYAGFVADVSPGVSDRAVEETVLERAWTDAGADGIFDESTDDLSVPPGRLPDGYNVYLEVTTLANDGDRETVASFFVDAAGNSRSSVTPPPEARSASRPIGVHLEDVPAGDVRGGRLRVEVWSR